MIYKKKIISFITDPCKNSLSNVNSSANVPANWSNAVDDWLSPIADDDSLCVKSGGPEA